MPITISTLQMRDYYNYTNTTSSSSHIYIAVLLNFESATFKIHELHKYQDFQIYILHKNTNILRNLIQESFTHRISAFITVCTVC